MKFLISYPKQTEKNSVFKTFFTDSALERLGKLGEIVYNEGEANFTPDEMKEALKGVDVVFTCWGTPKFDENVLTYADNLKMVCHAAGSAMPVISDDAALENHGIPVFSGNKYFAQSVAEGAVLYMLSGGRWFVDMANEMKNDGWAGPYRYKTGLRGKKIGLIGFGEIAKDVVPLVKAFQPEKVMVYSGYLSKETADKYGVEVATMEEIFSQCEFISVHSGLNAQNYHFVKEEHMRMMVEDAVLVNTARGPVIDEEAMVRVFKDRPDLRAVLDVYSEEPLPMNHEMREVPNLTLIPHQGGPTTDYRGLVVHGLIDDIEKMIAGRDDFDNLVSFEQAKRQTDESLRKKK